MFRIRDPAVSLDFYTRVFGMTYAGPHAAGVRRVDGELIRSGVEAHGVRCVARVLHEMRMEAGKFTNYFLAYVKKDDIPTDPAALHQFMTSQPGVLELCQCVRALASEEVGGTASGTH